MLVPMPGRPSTTRSNRARCPGWRIQAQNAAVPPTSATAMSSTRPRTMSDTATMIRVDTGRSAPKLP